MVPTRIKQSNNKVIDLTFGIVPSFIVVVFASSYTSEGDNRTCHRTRQFEIECHHFNLNVIFSVTSLSMHNWHWMYIFIIRRETLKDTDRYVTLMG